ncbi:hypothetical protein [Cellulomonas sp. PhB143]|uniref:hypothetical protein n=1 Tax=Cellulomonas sp. PhB143 TaxID=2485186 RepID=UPI0011CDF9C8|nr:hypothetical protein [Cellulomonas sp. PhB143]
MVSAIEQLRSGKISRLRGYGLEVNPFLQFVTATKTSSALNGAAPAITTLASLVACAQKTRVAPEELPSLSTFGNERFFPREHVEQLVALRRAIDEADIGDADRNWARLALAMTVEPASRLRRDGRTLRYEDRAPLAPYEVFVRALERIAEDVPELALPSGDVQIRHGSALNPGWGVEPGAADLVLFSPPYPNNIDYTEVYKTELWALGFVANQDEFREQRQRTLRSHPSVKFRRELKYPNDARGGDVTKLIDPVIGEIPSDSRYAKSLERMIEGYADDMLTVFDAAYKALRQGGFCVYIVGNSVHGTSEAPVMIASDVMLARLGEIAGFTVESINIARTLPRRRIDSAFVRESLVVLRKEA